ncbi:MAG: DNA-binding protein WhiA, partial [Enterococcus sp.]|nr:DNA-binding protein WhiA [Enterococcus sp.]
EQVASGMVEILQKKGIGAKITYRGSNYLFYMKNANSIKDFLTYIGAPLSVLKFEEHRVIKSVAAQVNRVVNCELGNIKKAKEASFQQIEEIRLLLNNCNINDLPKGLEEYVRIRIQNPDLSLSELGEMFEPKISKTAVYHRVRRITELCEKYKK